jgi:4-amino-4-deoxy-L-arabinose transferase-like glycosyltransferase
MCALIACLNAVCWSVITPAFQSPDEPDHFAYVQQLAETGTLPNGGPLHSQEEEIALRDLEHGPVRFHGERYPVGTQAAQRQLEQDLARPLRRVGDGGAGVAGSEPPLYYALEAIPYAVGSGGTLLDRLALMRLLSALMGGLTALFVYMFVREALPREPWAWAVGGLAVALAPLLGFMSGVVNPDALLYTVSAALFYLLARGFRRGLTTKLAVAIGALTAAGLLTKLNFVGVAPGVVVGLVLLARREARSSSARKAYRSLSIGLAIPLAPVCLYIVVNLFSNHAGLGVVSDAINLTGHRGSIFHEIGYIWQFYLPRLPGMAHDFPGISTTRDIWFNRSVGLYGWLDTPFPLWVDNLALIPAVLLAILGIRGLVMVRATLGRRLVELAVYALITIGVMTLVAADSFASLTEEGSYGEPRYLLPMLPLLGAALALSARGAGKRWGPVAGTLIVLLFLAHDILSQLQVVSRFYA